MKLAGELDRFRARGLGLAAVSYDSVELLKEFATRKQIPFPLLSDPGSQVIARFGLLHPDYPPGHDWHGLPFPTTLVADAAGIVRTSRVEEEDYKPRPTPGSLFVRAGDRGVGEREVRTDFFVVRSSASDAEVFPGNRVTLVLDVEMAEGHHAYAPGAVSYRGLSLTLDPNPLVETGVLTLPEPRSYHFEPLDETVPVFEGHFRLLQDVTLVASPEAGALAASADPVLRLTGTLGYQVCSDRVCYPPGRLPLEWSFSVLPLERERTPETLRRPD